MEEPPLTSTHAPQTIPQSDGLESTVFGHGRGRGRRREEFDTHDCDDFDKTSTKYSREKSYLDESNIIGRRTRQIWYMVQKKIKKICRNNDFEKALAFTSSWPIITGQ